jgi:DNA/RNA endonuclease G (NUC1)/PKD repeat protein
MALLGLLLAAGSCSERGAVEPAFTRPQFSSAPLPLVRIAEFHYDNSGTDTNESVEISGPAGTDLSGWQLVLYNGTATSRAPYTTTNLSGLIPATCGTRGVIVINYPVNGIQNGGSTATGTTDPDGIALVDNTGAVVEFSSYEGSFVAASGPAAGLSSVDIGVRELGTEQASPVFSLQRDSSGVWQLPALNTFGACNDGSGQTVGAVATVTVTPASATVLQGATQQFTAAAFDAASQPVATTFTWSSSAPSIASVNANGLATALQPGDASIIATAPNGVADTAALHVDAPPPPPALPATRFSELHYDNFGTDTGEAIEVEGPAGTALTGWSIVLYNGNGGVAYNTAPLSGTIPDLCNGRGVVVVNYPQDGIQNGSPDGFALIDAQGAVVEFLSYEGTFSATDGPAAGRTSVDIGVLESSPPVGQSLQRDTLGNWSGPITSTIGGCNNGPPPPPPTNSISFSGRLVNDPALPVGFEDQLFATERDPTNVVIPTTFTWTSETPAIATIDQDGVFRALAVGTATFRATAADGTTATYSLPTRVAVGSPTAVYAGNAEFGEPADNDASDDFIVRRAQYTLSYNPNRNTPNWVSYNLEATHFGPEDRCDCFTFDPALPAGFAHYTTADYTGAGTFHGYGIDRGHLARSFDRTAGSLDNATTFYFSNIIPQAADLNQGPWAIMENVLGDYARLQNKEVYIVAGVAGSKGTIKNQGKIVIPEKVWKVALIMPRDQGLAQVTSEQSIEVIAAIMPNDPGVRNVNWETYRTTVDAVEALSGYDVLALLPDKIETAVESGTHAPVARTDGPYTSLEGSSVALSGAGSSDADAGQTLTYTWSFGDGWSATGANVTHTYAQDGSYTVQLIVTDPLGIADTATTSATVQNVAPAIAAFAGATLLPGETFTVSGSFTDPGADAWSATVDYGDGGGTSALALVGQTFALTHTYNAAGTFTVTVRVTDDDATGTRTQSVVVLTPVQAVQNAIGLVNDLMASGKLSGANGNALKVKLNTAQKQLERNNSAGATSPLQGVLDQLDDYERTGVLSAADAQPLRELVSRILQSITR